MKKLQKGRYIRRYSRLVVKWLLVAIIVWFIIFNAYAFHYKLEEISALHAKLKLNLHPGVIPIHDQNRLNSVINNNFKIKPQNSTLFKSTHINKLQSTSVQYFDAKTIEFSKKIQNSKFKNSINCESIVEFDLNEITKAKHLIYKLNSTNKINPEANYIFDKEKCKLFRQIRGYDQHSIKQSEYEFPLAFSILVHHNVEQLERLLKLIYRPHNLYCIHIDAKSPKISHDAIKSIVQCFDNVIISSKLENIIYAGISRLKADINCMHDLFYSNFSYNNTKWKYFINLASTEFPLRTNYELTRILRLYNGANDIEVLRAYPKDRYKYSWVAKKVDNKYTVARTNHLKSPPPYNFTIYKGIAYGVFSREFVNFVLNDKHAQSLFKWAEDTSNPDEWFWATLQSNTRFHPPGGYKDASGNIVSSKARFIGWKGKYKCNGYFRHNICVFSVGDIPVLLEKNDFFANKFDIDYDPIAYQCMEDWITERIASNHSVNMLQYCRQSHLQAYINHTHCF